jgi:hypothetical protein
MAVFLTGFENRSVLSDKPFFEVHQEFGTVLRPSTISLTNWGQR